MTDENKKADSDCAGALALLAAASWAYVSDYYRADEMAWNAISEGGNAAIRQIEGKGLAFEPEAAQTGLIFYPGGKVEYLSYAPLMRALAEENVLCVLIEMPLNLAVLDMNAADGVMELYPEIDSWYIGGHSLGGSMAASYAQKHEDELEGLVLLASYSTTDLSASGLDVISIYGSEDGVLNKQKYDESRKNLPEDAQEHVIEGGCHAYFGSYGEQEGDGVPRISAEEQIETTVRLLTDFFGKE